MQEQEKQRLSWRCEKGHEYTDVLARGGCPLCEEVFRMDVERFNRPIESPPDACRGCGKQLVPYDNNIFADGCPCNSERGVNHGLVMSEVCTCKICDPAQTGASRIRPPQEQSDYIHEHVKNVKNYTAHLKSIAADIRNHPTELRHTRKTNGKFGSATVPCFCVPTDDVNYNYNVKGEVSQFPVRVPRLTEVHEISGKVIDQMEDLLSSITGLLNADLTYDNRAEAKKLFRELKDIVKGLPSERDKNFLKEIEDGCRVSTFLLANSSFKDDDFKTLAEKHPELCSIPDEFFRAVEHYAWVQSSIPKIFWPQI